MDLITDLLLVNGLNSVMVVVDHGLNKGVILAPCTKTVDTAGISNFVSTTSSNSLDYTKKLYQTADSNSLQPSPGNLQDSYNMA